MGGDAVRIYDTSLRDGLRNSHIAIGPDDKIRFVRQLERIGVDDIVRLLQPRADAFSGLHCAVDEAGLLSAEQLLAEISQPTDEADSDVTELLRRWGGKAG